jgi:hypothetical protein
MFFHDCDERDVDIAAANVSHVNSLVPVTWKSTITSERFGRIPRAYIETFADRALPIEVQRRYQSDVPGAAAYSIDSGHSPFFCKPAQVSEIILRCLRGDTSRL